MIKRFASHFIFLPGHGYLKQYVVGVEEGQVVSAFPLTEEMKYYRNFRKFSAQKRFLPE